MPSHIKRINWRLLAVHFLAVPFLILGARQLQLIRFIDVVELYQQDGLEAAISLLERRQATVIDFILWAQTGPLYAWFLAIVAACLLSSLVVWRRQESRLIPLLLFTGALISSWMHYYERSVVKEALAFLRHPFEQFPLEVRLAIVGGILVAIGVILLLLPLRWRIGAGTIATS